MMPSEDIKPISYFKAHASEVIKDVSDNRKTLIITQNGEAKVIVQDIRSFEQSQESLALLKILELSANNLKEGRINLDGRRDLADLLQRRLLRS
ncbi:MAG: type II toxin-antitoxin system Phd/YefM family antitoxin [Smithellaceae bacterium]|jgi:prevent-host-death family protein|nr:type II toxin-antitoxin system Phd/YefM family antitoxin [Smithellaceae bacterium]MDD3259496.1 type II toxin-antitoxin system Phd/YefM family antitoxin [Smithellaceae bacterium]MDD3849581.1 type II toxin-antitoxin system Phd/YefM family antitoxin [Smithellaceae bacterium]HOQ72519.1 type II toxin-antitoxin system Phd/YefM family antitoxin [Smithellaceae bacterium]